MFHDKLKSQTTSFDLRCDCSIYPYISPTKLRFLIVRHSYDSLSENSMLNIIRFFFPHTAPNSSICTHLYSLCLFLFLLSIFYPVSFPSMSEMTAQFLIPQVIKLPARDQLLMYVHNASLPSPDIHSSCFQASHFVLQIFCLQQTVIKVNRNKQRQLFSNLKTAGLPI